MCASTRADEPKGHIAAGNDGYGPNSDPATRKEPAMTAPTIPGRRTRPRRPAPSTAAVGYLRVSTADQADSGAGLDAQRAAVTAYADRHGLHVIAWHTDAGVSGGVAPDDRPGMSAALDDLQARRAGTLIAAKLDRVSRSVRDAADLQARATGEGWTLRTADGVAGGDDSPMGRAMVGVAAVFSELERGLISVRTREALAARRADGQLGKPTTLPTRLSAGSFANWPTAALRQSPMDHGRRIKTGGPRPVARRPGEAGRQ